MHSTLHKYLALHKKLDIPDVGSLSVEPTPATLQFADKQFLPPASVICFTPDTQPINNHFFSFLAREWNLDKVIAIRRFKDEADSIAGELQQTGAYDLAGIGVLRKEGADEPTFTPSKFFSQPLFAALPAERVLRRDAQHTVLVGEQEHIKAHTDYQTTDEVLYEEAPAKEKWKLYALILAILAVLMIVYYYAAYR